MDWEYTREKSKPEPLVGNYRCVIVDVDTGVTGPGSKKPGTPKIIVTVRPSGTKFKVRKHIPKDERFNKTMADLFDSFPEIGDGNFNFIEWVGCEGAAEFGEDKSGYTDLKWFISGRKKDELPPFEGEKPERQTEAKLSDEEDGEEDDLPWV